MKKIIYILFIIIISASCNKTNNNPQIDFGYDYYPNDSSYFRLYEVEDILYNDFQQTTDTINYQMVEVFDRNFKDLEGRDSQELKRFRQNPNGTWTLLDVWQATKTDTRVEQVEENIRIIKLIFPVKVGNNWNGYAFAGIDDESFEVESKVQDTVINDINIEELVTVTHYNNKNFIEQQTELEKFGKGIGMVHRYYVNLNLQKDSGIIRSVWIKDFGTNFPF